MIKDILKNKNGSDMVTDVLILAVMLLISTLLLRFLWNESLVKHITVFKPINSLLDAFLLSIGLYAVKCC